MKTPGKNCSIVGCDNTQQNTKGRNPLVHFYVFPSRPYEVERRQAWINFVKRETNGRPWSPTSNSRICSDHFIGNKKSNNPLNPSYNPSIQAAVRIKSNPASTVRRYERATKRQAPPGPKAPPSVPPPKSHHVSTQTEITPFRSKRMELFTCFLKNNEASCQVQHKLVLISKPVLADKAHLAPKVNVSVGTELRSCCFFGYDSVATDEAALRDLTSVSPAVFRILLDLLPKTALRTIDVSWENRLLLTLIKLKSGNTHALLGRFFGIHSSTTSKIFQSTIESLYQELRYEIIWPSKHTVKATLPPAFIENYPDTRVIIDCTEIKTERPPGVHRQVLMYSQYKSAYTVKYFIGMTPGGLISFLSPGYGGRATDSFITVDSGFLDKLEPNDLVMADKGFPQIQVGVSEKDAVFVMPPFADSSQPQFSEADMNKTYHIASVRIHVERIIGRLKIYKILQHRVPIDLLPYIDKIVHVCCVLANLQSEIIKEK